MEKCCAEGMTVTMTVSFCVPQVWAIGKRYQAIVAKKKGGAKVGRCFSVIMIGRLDDYLREVFADNQEPITESELRMAGLSVVKHAYQLYRENGFDAMLLIAALRGNYHMTGLAGELTMSIHPTYQKTLLEEPWSGRRGSPSRFPPRYRKSFTVRLSSGRLTQGRPRGKGVVTFGVTQTPLPPSRKRAGNRSRRSSSSGGRPRAPRRPRERDMSDKKLKNRSFTGEEPGPCCISSPCMLFVHSLSRAAARVLGQTHAAVRSGRPAPASPPLKVHDHAVGHLGQELRAHRDGDGQHGLVEFVKNRSGAIGSMPLTQIALSDGHGELLRGDLEDPPQGLQHGGPGKLPQSLKMVPRLGIGTRMSKTVWPGIWKRSTNAPSARTASRTRCGS